jgi:hypothetical protein
LEQYCLGLILANPTALAMANEILEKQGLPALNINDFKAGDNREIFKSLHIWTAAETPHIETLSEMIGETLDQQLAGLVSRWYHRPSAPAEDIHRDLSGIILRLRLKNIAEQINELKSLQHQAADSSDNRYYTEMVENYRQQRKILEQTRDALSLMGKRRLEANQYGEPI